MALPPTCCCTRSPRGHTYYTHFGEGTVGKDNVFVCVFYVQVKGYSLPGSAGSSSDRSRTAGGRRHYLSSGRDWPSATESPAASADRYTEFPTRQILDPAVFLSIDSCVQPEKNFTKRNEEYIEYNVDSFFFSFS